MLTEGERVEHIGRQPRKIWFPVANPTLDEVGIDT